MLQKLFTGLLVIAIACCLFGYTTLHLYHSNEIGSTETNASLVVHEEVSHPTTPKKTKAVFLQFVYQVSQLATINSSDGSLWLEAKQYFPQITQFTSHDLNLQYISSQDSLHLIFFEFRQQATGKGAMFLANFNTWGEQMDHLTLKAITFDGNLSINLIDEKIIEVAYIDFEVKNYFERTNNYIQKQDEYSKRGYRLIPEREIVFQKRYIPKTEFEYYKIGSDHKFVQLTKNTTIQEGRTYPQTATRIISAEEFSLMKEKERDLMQQEIYASHGFIFSDEKWSAYFSEMDWYDGLYNDVVPLLSDVERVNISRILELRKSL